MRRPLPALLALAACGTADAPDAWTTRVDTLPGGAIQVVNTPPPGDVPVTWRIEEEVRIGSLHDEGPASFGQVRGFGVLPDGRFAVLDGQAQEVRIFAGDGAHVRTWGGQGEGPGEFRGANGLLVGPDGVIRVYDPRNARLTFLHPDSGVVGSAQQQVESWGWVWGAAMDSAGRIYEEVYHASGDERWTALKVLDPAGAWTDTIRLERLPDRPTPGPGIYVYEIPGGRGMAQVPFWPQQLRIPDPPDAVWTRPRDETAYRLTRTGFDGDTTHVLETRRDPVPVTPAEREAAIADIREAAGQELDWSRIPAEKPMVETLSLDDRGRLWVRVAADSLTTYDVYERDGRYAGTATTPLRTDSWIPPVVVGDRFHAVVRDELDVQYVVRGRLVPVGGGPAPTGSASSSP